MENLNKLKTLEDRINYLSKPAQLRDWIVKASRLYYQQDYAAKIYDPLTRFNPIEHSPPDVLNWMLKQIELHDGASKRHKVMKSMEKICVDEFWIPEDEDRKAVCIGLCHIAVTFQLDKLMILMTQSVYSKNLFTSFKGQDFRLFEDILNYTVKAFLPSEAAFTV